MRHKRFHPKIYFENVDFRSWQQDYTEGPVGERKRLKKCHLDLEDRFFLDESKGSNKDESM